MRVDISGQPDERALEVAEGGQARGRPEGALPPRVASPLPAPAARRRPSPAGPPMSGVTVTVSKGKAWARDGIPEDFEFDELPFDMQHAEPELERMFARMPG